MAKPDNTLLRKKREEKQEAKNGLKFVIDGAKIKCNSCTIPHGDLKANYDTPSIQDKRVVTVVENNMMSLIFKGNCKKSFLNLSPCTSVMKLGEWKNPGTVYFQDELAVLLRSTIKCEYGGVDITIWDCGQRNEINNLDTLGAPVPNMERIINVNGHFYNKDGTFEGKINEPDYEGSVNDVYVCDGKSTKKDKNGNEALTYNNTKLLKENEVNITHEKFIIFASTVYAESSIGYGIIDKYELFAIASVHKRNKIAYGANSPSANKFIKKKDDERNGTTMIHAIAAEINVLQNGQDYSNGAKQWDGAEQTNLPKDENSSSNGEFMFKINVMGWEITDELYEKWKSVVSSKFGSTYFNVPQKKYAVANYGGMKNKNKIRLQSSAQYGLTMFWKEVDVSKPKEEIK